MDAHITGKELKGVDSGAPLTLGGREYSLVMDFNVICDLEDHYGSFDKAGKALSAGKMKDVRFLLFAMLRQGNEALTERDVGKMLTIRNMSDVMDALGAAMTVSMPEAESPNAKSPQK